MAASAHTRGRSYRLIAIAALAGLLSTGCASAKAGKGVPDGDEAASYVSAKFSESLNSLRDDLSADQPRKSKLDWFGRIDGKKADQTVTAIQVGSPPSRYVKEHSNRDPSVYLERFHPAGSTQKYILLGPYYSSLAPTPWVSMPYTEWNLNACAWEGYRTVCAMLNSLSDAVDRGNAAKEAASLVGGGVKLRAKVTLRDFLRNKVIPFPDRLLGKVPENMQGEPVATTVVLGPKGDLRSISMNANIADSGHEVEIRMKYRVLAPPTKADLPEVPAPENVTKLADEAAVDDFYKRMGELD